MKINALGYVGFEAPNAKEWETFGPEVFGFGLGEPGEDGTVYLRMDDRPYRIAIHPGEEQRIAYIGWELKDKKSFTEAVAELTGEGLNPELGTPAECKQRAVQGLARFRDPFDYVHEVFYSPTFTAGSFRPGKPMHGFVADSDGVGHVVLAVPEWTDDMERFVTKTLGMELFAGFVAPTPAGTLAGPQFFRCNPRSHCLGYLALPGLRGVQHICIEARNLDDVGKAYDIVQEREMPITMSLGRHMMDTLVSFYMRSPTGFDIEFGAGGVVLDENYVQVNPSTPEAWGHKFLTPGWAPTVKPIAGA